MASIAEVRLVAETLPEAVSCFMHPVKAEEAIAEAYFTHNVRTFSLDTIEELEKIVARHRSGATDLNLLVRIRVSSEHAKLSLAAKFGAEPAEMKALLMATRQAADALGICFHVGSQAMTPAAYAEAMERVRAAIVEAAVTVDIVDVGGGFPSCYPGHGAAAARGLFRIDPPRLRGPAGLLFVRIVVRARPRALRRICEPAGPRREAPRRQLYINDGAYGALFDAAHIGWRFPVRLIREQASDARDMAFSFYGPTCDDLDHMAGPFHLPADTAAGDYVEIGMLGAYGCAMRSQFNGFGAVETRIVADEPMASLYVELPAEPGANVVPLRGPLRAGLSALHTPFRGGAMKACPERPPSRTRARSLDCRPGCPRARLPAAARR